MKLMRGETFLHLSNLENGTNSNSIKITYTFFILGSTENTYS